MLRKFKKYPKGFTLTEILLVIALLGILAAFTAPIAWSFFMQNNLDSAADVVAQSIRRAQSLAALGSQNSSWGVNLQKQTLTIFEGSSFDARNSDLDEIETLPIEFDVSGSTEIIFNKFTGIPTAPGEVTLATPLNQTRTISVNAYGMVSY